MKKKSDSVIQIRIRTLCTFIILFLALFTVPCKAQQKVTLLLNETTIRHTIEVLQKKYGYSFSIKLEDVNLEKKINVNITSQEITSVLKYIFNGQNVTYTINGKTIIISKNTEQEKKPIKEKAPFILEGTVTDMDGKLAGATIMIKGTSTGTVSDAKGYFNIKIPNEGAILTVSFMGYETKEIKISSARKNISVAMSSAYSNLEEVVVVGYGTQKKENLTGSVVSIAMDDVGNRPTANIGTALQGKVTGAYISQISGQPGNDGATINIRGIGTFNNAAPLVLIDGVESDLNVVDPKDIASISILKDAASSSIYGAKAANGVILITTKRGETGKIKVELNSYFGIQEATRLPKLLNAVEYMELRNEAYRNSKGFNLYEDKYIDNWRNHVDPMIFQDNDWFDIFYDPAFMQNHHLSLTGGKENFTFLISGGYLSQDGIVEATSFEKFNFRSNFDSYFIKDKLHFQFNISGHRSTKKDLPWGANSAIEYINKYSPIHGYKFPHLGYGEAASTFAQLENKAENSILQNLFNARAMLNYEIIKGLNIETSYAITWDTYDNKQFIPKTSTYTLFYDGTVTESPGQESLLNVSNYQFFTGTFNALIQYDLKIKDHNIKTMLGTQSFYNNAKSLLASRKKFTVNKPFLEYGDPSTEQNNNKESEVAMLSYFGRINYDYKGKYLLEGNLRYDGSSRFQKGSKWGAFPSISAGWRISEEDFFKKNISFIPSFKLRGSWGLLGNEQVASKYVSYDLLGFESSYIIGNEKVPAASLVTLANKATTWETTKQWNIGVDITLFKNLDITFDFFQKQTSDILMQIPVSSILGLADAPFQNAGEVNNKGWEFSANYRHNIGKVSLDYNINLSHVKNTITDLAGRDPILTNNGYCILTEGQAINAFYGYAHEGIYQSLEEIENHLEYYDKNGNKNPVYHGLIAEPGDIRFKDQNGDGKIDYEHDRVVIGKPFPDLNYSFQIGASWNGFDTSLFFQGVYGIDALNVTSLVAPFADGANCTKWMLKRWTPEKPSKTYQRVYEDAVRPYISSTYYLEDASYLRLKNVELGYAFPKKWISKIGISYFRLYGNIQNALTFTHYKGFDPEKPSGIVNASAHPQVRIYTLGFNLHF